MSGHEYNATRPWRETAALAQARRATSLLAVHPPSLPQDLPLNVTNVPKHLLTAREIEITGTDPVDILGKLATKAWTCKEVTYSLLRRAAVASGLTNCLTDLLADRVLSRAEELDAYIIKYNRPIGPLHGLPISVKEHVGMRGLDINLGYCTFYGRIAEEDALILQILSNAGAVFHCRTTEPQTLMHLETDNNLYGVTTNPFNTRLASGGSSGGEAALIAMGGSVLGIGSDIGGSIRVPAANCGLFGLKPSTGRLPMHNVEDGAEGFDQILTAIGPLSKSMELIKIFMKVILDAKPWTLDSACVPLPWRIDEPWLPRKLRVGVFWDDGVVMPHPPVLRALKEVVASLQGADDVDVVQWSPYKHDEAWEIIATLYYPDGADDDKAALEASGEPSRPLTDFIIFENPHVRPGGLDKEKLRRAVARRDSYRQQYMEHWNATAKDFDENHSPIDPVDVILCPVGPGAAPPHDCSRYWGYTSLWNLLDFPGLTFPWTTVDPTLDLPDEGYEPRNSDDKYNHELYDPAVYVDAPVSLQLVSRRFEEEKLIQAYERMSTHFRRR